MRGQPAESAPQFGAPHSADLAYAFGTLDQLAEFDWRPEDRATSETLIAFLVNFIKNGDPNGPGLPAWPQLGADHPAVMTINDRSHATTIGSV
jgi:para-nitrobenzyl esterase